MDGGSENSQAAQNDADIQQYQADMRTAATQEDAQAARDGLASAMFARYVAGLSAEDQTKVTADYEDAFQRFQAAMAVFGGGQANSLGAALKTAGLAQNAAGINSVLAYAARQMAEGNEMRYAMHQNIDTSAEHIEENKQTVANMAAVKILNGNEFVMDTEEEKARGERRLLKEVKQFFSTIGMVYSNEIGDVILSSSSVKNDFGHGMGEEKAAAFAAVKEVIEKGRVIEYTKNYNNKGYDRAVIAAPIKIAGNDYYMGVMINRYNDHQRFYLHEVWLSDEIKENGRNAVQNLALDAEASERNQVSSSAHVNSILDSLRNYKGENKKFSLKADAEYMAAAERGDEEEAQTETEEFKRWFGNSQVVNEDGTPMVMYHGTDAYKEFNVFKQGKKGWLGPGIYMTADKAYAQRYANQNGYEGRVYETYVKIENPLIVKEAEPAQEILRAAYGNDTVYNRRVKQQGNGPSMITKADINKLAAQGYDGIIWQYGTTPLEVSAFSANQIKSATDNIGTFDPENPDIRYELRGDTEADTEAQALEDVRADAELYSQAISDEFTAQAIDDFAEIYKAIERVARNMSGDGTQEGNWKKRTYEIANRLKTETGSTMSTKEAAKWISRVFQAIDRGGYVINNDEKGAGPENGVCPNSYSGFVISGTWSSYTPPCPHSAPGTIRRRG